MNISVNIISILDVFFLVLQKPKRDKSKIIIAIYI